MTLKIEDLEEVIQRAADAAATRAVFLSKQKSAAPVGDWISKQAACQMLSCSYVTLRQRVLLGYIRQNNYRPRGMKMYRLSDVQDYINGKRIERFDDMKQLQIF